LRDLEAKYFFKKKDKLSKAMACDGDVANWHCLFEPPLPFHLLSLERFSLFIAPHHHYTSIEACGHYDSYFRVACH
jgi:hypothetical protein